MPTLLSLKTARAVLWSQMSDRGIGPQLVFELGGDVDPARTGVDGVVGAEEAVRLQDEFAAEAVLVVDEQGSMPRLPSSIAAERPAGPPPMMSTGTGISSIGRISERSGDLGESGRPSTGSTCMPGRTSSMQDLTGRPSASTRHWAHWPLAQKMPCGA